MDPVSKGITVLVGQTIERLWPAPATATPPAWDPTALTSEEMVELSDLLAEPERYQRRTGTTDYARCYTATLDAAQLARLEMLMAKVIA